MPQYYNPRYQQEITGEWKGKTAGGCQNNTATYKNNPVYQLVLNNREGNNHSTYERNGNEALIIFQFISS